MFASVRTAKQGPFWRKLLAFLGPGYLVAVGYMDPGNWATSLAGGSKFGYALLFIALLSNVMAIVLQSLCTRLGVGAGRDLAQACRDAFPRWVSLPLWLSAEVAITATDLAEVIGTAIGLNLLFHIPLEIGVIITAADVFLILALQAFGFRWIEAFVVAMLGVIAARGVFCRADCDGRSGLGRGAPGVCADVGHSGQPRDAVSGARDSRRHRDAA
jgi:manganese transport protein